MSELNWVLESMQLNDQGLIIFHRKFNHSQDSHEVSPDGLLGVLLLEVGHLLLVVRQLLRDLVQLLGTARVALSGTLGLNVQ